MPPPPPFGSMNPPSPARIEVVLLIGNPPCECGLRVDAAVQGQPPFGSRPIPLPALMPLFVFIVRVRQR
jgi:hypothetical protein